MPLKSVKIDEFSNAESADEEIDENVLYREEGGDVIKGRTNATFVTSWQGERCCGGESVPVESEPVDWPLSSWYRWAGTMWVFSKVCTFFAPSAE